MGSGVQVGVGVGVQVGVGSCGEGGFAQVVTVHVGDCSVGGLFRWRGCSGGGGGVQVGGGSKGANVKGI